MLAYLFSRSLPPGLEGLAELALDGDISRNGHLRTLSTGEPETRGSERTEVPFRGSLVDAPQIIAGEADMFSTER